MADWARAAGLRVAGLIEMLEEERVGGTRHGFPIVALAGGSVRASAVLGMGGDRRAAWERLAERGWSAGRVVHPAAVVAFDARLGAGAAVGPVAAIGACSSIGEHAMVSRGVLVGHHARVGAYATLNPGANIGGNSTVGEDAFIGMGATVVNGATVGEGAVVAAGAVVIGDVEAHSRVQGVPARAVAVEVR